MKQEIIKNWVENGENLKLPLQVNKKKVAGINSGKGKQIMPVSVYKVISISLQFQLLFFVIISV